ncbi:hypothetical protein ACFDR9_005340, partial [Janthinobacterium sp. CG_23.3]
QHRAGRGGRVACPIDYPHARVTFPPPPPPPPAAAAPAQKKLTAPAGDDWEEF